MTKKTKPHKKYYPGDPKVYKSRGGSSWARNKMLERMAATEKRNAKEGHVYIFSLGHDGLYKIGCTYSIEKRLKALGSSCPKIKCIWSAWSKDMYELENILHKKFHKSKVHNEIYTLEPQQIISANHTANNYRDNYGLQK